MPHPTPHEEVRRPRLEARLDAVVPGGLALLSASAGSGKSVLVHRWADHRPRLRVAALPLTNRHDDAVTLARALIGSIRAAAPEVDHLLEGLAAGAGASLGEDVVEALADRLSTLDDGLVIVLEDLHTLSNRAVLSDLGRLAAALPATTRMVATTRSDPPWRLQRLRLAGTLTEIRSADLAFQRKEAKALLESVARRELSDGVVAALGDRTDGWAVGLQLAAISLRTAPDPEAFVASFAGSDRLVAEYLLDEVIDRQEPAVQRFLLETCVLDRLSGDLCDAVTGLGNARQMLDELYRRSMFLIPLDTAGKTFRYHHLFAEVLRYRLGIEGAGQVRELNRRAAQWLVKHGEEERGIGHLIQAHDDEAVRVISTMGHRLFERGESATLVRWLEHLGARDPDGSVESMINLLAAQFGADESEAATDTYRRILRRPGLSLGERTVAQTLYTLQVVRGLAPEVVIELTDEVRDNISRLEPDDVVDFLGLGGLESIRVMNEYSTGMAHFFTGDLHHAGVVLERARILSGTAYPLWRVYVVGALSMVRAWQGHATESLGLARRAIDDAQALGIPFHHASAAAHLAVAMVHLDRVELEESEHSLSEVRLRIQARPASFTYFDLHGALEAWSTALRKGPDEALAVLREPPVSGKEAPILRQARRALRMRLLIGSADVPGARAVLDGALEREIPASVRVDLLLAEGDRRAARETLETWRADPVDQRDTVRRMLRCFALIEAEGEDRAARQWLERAVAAARGDRLRWPFLEVPASLRVLKRTALHDSSWLTSHGLWEAAVALHPRIGAQDGLSEPLTQRELDVLAYLPGRMRNQEIAADMYVSVNTVKTHIASIYRKLEVTERNEAVERAFRLGLL